MNKLGYTLSLILFMLVLNANCGELTFRFVPMTWNKDDVSVHAGAGYYRDLFTSRADEGVFGIIDTPVVDITSSVSIDVGLFIPVDAGFSVRPNVSINYKLDRLQIGLLTGVSSVGVLVEFTAWYF